MLMVLLCLSVKQLKSIAASKFQFVESFRRNEAQRRKGVSKRNMRYINQSYKRQAVQPACTDDLRQLIPQAIEAICNTEALLFC